MLDVEQVKKDLNIDPIRLTENMIEHPSLFVHYAMKSREAHEAMSRAKMAVELAESKADKAIRDEMTEAGEKITEAVIGKKLITNGLVIKAKKAYNEAKGNYELCRDIKEAWSQRRDMLIQIGSDLRNERKANPSINEESSEERKARLLKR